MALQPWYLVKGYIISQDTAAEWIQNNKKLSLYQQLNDWKQLQRQQPHLTTHTNVIITMFIHNTSVLHLIWYKIY